MVRTLHKVKLASRLALREAAATAFLHPTPKLSLELEITRFRQTSRLIARFNHALIVAVLQCVRTVKKRTVFIYFTVSRVAGRSQRGKCAIFDVV